MLLVSCSYQDNNSFIKKYENEDFSPFINTGIHIRGNDEVGDPILFISDDLENADKKGPVIVIVSRNKKSIKQISFNLSKDSLNVDQVKLKQLALKFLNYKVFSLMVDANNNVFLRLKESDKPTLARFSHQKFVTTADVFKGKWKLLKGSWYEVE